MPFTHVCVIGRFHPGTRSTEKIADRATTLQPTGDETPLLRAMLRETSGNQRNTLRKKLTEHGIDPDSVEG